MSDPKRTTLTPDERKRRNKNLFLVGAAVLLAGSTAGLLYFAKPSTTITPPVEAIPNKANPALFPVDAVPVKQPPTSLGDVIISPPEIDMGSVIVGEGHYTGTFVIKIAGVSAKINKIEIPFAQQTGLKLDTTACIGGDVDTDQSCLVSFIFDPPYPGRVNTQVTIQAQLHLSNGTSRLQTVTANIIGDAVKPAPPPIAQPTPSLPSAAATEGVSEDALAYLRRRQRPGQLDRQFDPASFQFETDQPPKQDNWRSINYGPNYSTMPVDMTRVLTMDKPIPAVIKIPIDTRHSARAIATVERDIYGGDGRLVIIERGSTLIGSAGSLTNPSEEKVGISWERIVRPDGSAWSLAATSGDAMGRSGAVGIIDRRWFDRFGVTLLTSAITASLNIALNASQTTTIGVGGTSTTTTTPAYLAMQQFQGDFRSIFSEFAKEQMAISPIITIPAGTRITVYPTTDLWLRPIKPTDDMRLAYARQQSSGAAYHAAEARAQAAAASLAAADQKASQTLPGQQSRVPYVQSSADAGGAAPRSNIPLTPVAGPGASQDPWLAPDSVTAAGSGQAGFVNGKSTSDALRATTTVSQPNPMAGSAYPGAGTQGYSAYGQTQFGAAPVPGGSAYQTQSAAPSWAGAVVPQP